MPLGSYLRNLASLSHRFCHQAPLTLSWRLYSCFDPRRAAIWVLKPQRLPEKLAEDSPLEPTFQPAIMWLQTNDSRLISWHLSYLSSLSSLSSYPSNLPARTQADQTTQCKLLLHDWWLAYRLQRPKADPTCAFGRSIRPCCHLLPVGSQWIRMHGHFSVAAHPVHQF